MKTKQFNGIEILIGKHGLPLRPTKKLYPFDAVTGWQDLNMARIAYNRHNDKYRLVNKDNKLLSYASNLNQVNKLVKHYLTTLDALSVQIISDDSFSFVPFRHIVKNK